MSNEDRDHNDAPSAGDDYSDAAGTEDGLVVTEEKQPLSRSTLIMFAVLVIGAAGLFIMYRKAGPKPAAAASTKQTEEAKKTISTFLTSGDANFKTMETRLKATERIVQQFLRYPSATQVPLSNLSTNPFRQHAAKETPAQQEGISEAALKKKQEEERLAVKKAAEALVLQSVIASETRRACMINSQLYREGETVGTFVIEKISPSSVLVKNGVYRFELRMQK